MWEKKEESSLKKNWPIIVALIAIFFIALFLRTYFAYDLATQGGFILSGGSDSYYHKRIIDYVVNTGHHLHGEPLLNYPQGTKVTGRPPMYDWSVALIGIAFSPLFSSVDTSVWYSFLFSTALWGALTVFPLYFLAKAAFGKKTALIAAFLIAIMPAHIQRSPFTNGDHDAYVLFFVVVAFFFFMNALRELETKKWVSNWSSPADIKAGLMSFFRESKNSILYSSLAAMSLTAIALAWKGFGYAIVIILVYFILQILVNRFRGIDSTGVVVCFGIAVGLSLLLSLPWYLEFGKIATFEGPFLMFLGALVLGWIFVGTRDYPWALIIPVVFLVFALALFLLFTYVPSTFESFISGSGYFIRSKAYETIAEAQPPTFSQQALSFGAVTYFLSLIGLAWAAVQIPKKMELGYLFVIVWSGAAIFMAMSAARFIFNAAPAFALTSAWVLIIIIEKLDLPRLKKTYDGLKGNVLHAIRRSVKLRHVAGVAFLAFMVMLPNVWYGVDAAIPFEKKRTYDEEIHNLIPDVLESSSYAAPWYFGAFGYSLPLKSRYWPAAWQWLSQQDLQYGTSKDRPAFLSWWDYGFEAVDEGKHPTVADNFLHGYQLAGNFITAQSENDAIALLTIRLLEGDFNKHEKKDFGQGVREVLVGHGLDPGEIGDVMRHSAAYIREVVNNPDRYGPRDKDMQPVNAMYNYLRVLLTERMDTDEQAQLYHDICRATGKSIGYFAVDSRLFPFSGGNPGIFYAPVKLSDHRIKDYRVRRDVPIDFFDLKCVDSKGVQHNCDEITPGEAISKFDIEYKDMFFKSMLYKAFIGFSEKEAGGKRGIPGLSGALQNTMPLQGWNLSHFKVIYRTAYYNPYPSKDVRNHTDAWRAINVYDALDLQQKIQSGEIQGVVDASPRSGIMSGVVILRYYDGAIVEGTVTVGGKAPLAGIRVTVSDELGTPHYTTITDAQGRYRVLAPFGQVSLTTSTGQLNNVSMIGSNRLNVTTFTVTEEQAMRLPQDIDGDGVYDYYISKDLALQGGTVKGKAFIDINGNELLDEDEQLLSNATLRFQHNDLPIEADILTGSDGAYEFEQAFPGTYRVLLVDGVHTIEPRLVNVTSGEVTDLNYNITGAKIAGVISYSNGLRAANVPVECLDEKSGQKIASMTNTFGFFEFDSLLPSNYTLTSVKDYYEVVPHRYKLSEGQERMENVTMVLSGWVKGRTWLKDDPVPYVWLRFEKKSHDAYKEVVVSDNGGFYQAQLPEGGYSIYAIYDSGGSRYVYLGDVYLLRNQTITHDVHLVKALNVHGTVWSGNTTQNIIYVTFDMGGARTTVVTDEQGNYSAILPEGTYTVTVGQQNFAFAKKIDVKGDMEFRIDLSTSISVTLTFYYDMNRDGLMQIKEPLSDVEVSLTDEEGNSVWTYTGPSGRSTVPLQSDERYTMKASHVGFEDVEMGPYSISELNTLPRIAMTPLDIEVEGQVWLAGEPFTDEELTLSFLAEGNGSVSSETTVQNGQFTVFLAPGDYRLELNESVGGQEKVRYQLVKESRISLLPGEVRLVMSVQITIRIEVAGKVLRGGNLANVNLEIRGGPEDSSSNHSNGYFSLFLEEGEYTFVCRGSGNDRGYSSVSYVVVHEPQNLTILLSKDVTVSGKVLSEGHEVIKEIPIYFYLNGGGLVQEVSSALAMYSVELPPQSYIARIDSRSVEKILGPPRYVRYTYSESFTVKATDVVKTFNINLEKELDNVTVEGTVVSGGVGVGVGVLFSSPDDSGINVTFVSAVNGSFSGEVAPGNYTVYIHKKEGHLTYFREIEVQPYVNLSVQLELEKGYRLGGHATYDGDLAKITQVTINGNGTLVAYSDSDGYFEVYLPEGTYDITAQTTDTELGRSVIYRGYANITLQEDELITISMSMKPSRAVRITWDSYQKKTVNAGDVVTYKVTVSNEGNVEDEFRMSSVPPTKDWTVEFSPAVVKLGVDCNKTVDVTITTPQGALVEHSPVTLVATSVEDSSANSQVQVDVGIRRARMVEMTPSSQLPDYDGNVMQVSLVIRNAGNAEDVFSVIILNREDLLERGWQVSIMNSTDMLPRNMVKGLDMDTNASRGLVVTLVPPPHNSTVEVSLFAFSEEDRSASTSYAFSVSSPTTKMSSKFVTAEGPNVYSQPKGDYTNYALPALIVLAAVALLIYMRRKK